MVIVAFFPESGARFQKITAGMVGLPLGILVDGELLAGPRVEEPVTTSRVVIGGLSLPRALILPTGDASVIAAQGRRRPQLRQ